MQTSKQLSNISHLHVILYHFLQPVSREVTWLQGVPYNLEELGSRPGTKYHFLKKKSKFK